MNPNLPSPRRPAGFTLVELLAVIAIIGILAAIIIPVTGKVRTNARQAQSVSNVKQIAQALLGYAGDNRGYLPQQATTGNFTQPVWTQRLTLYMSGGANPSSWGSLKVNPAFRDPLLDSTAQSGLGDYGNNTVVITTPLTAESTPQGAFNIRTAVNPSKLVVVGSAQELSGGNWIGCWYLNDYYWQRGATNYGTISGRDGGPAVLGFLDGSVRAIPMTDLATREQREALFANK